MPPTDACTIVSDGTHHERDLPSRPCSNLGHPSRDLPSSLCLTCNIIGVRLGGGVRVDVNEELKLKFLGKFTKKTRIDVYETLCPQQMLVLLYLMVPTMSATYPVAPAPTWVTHPETNPARCCLTCNIIQTHYASL